MPLHYFKMAGAGASENDEHSAPVEKVADIESQKKEITEEMKKPLRKGDTW